MSVFINQSRAISDGGLYHWLWVIISYIYIKTWFWLLSKGKSLDFCIGLLRLLGLLGFITWFFWPRLVVSVAHVGHLSSGLFVAEVGYLPCVFILYITHITWCVSVKSVMTVCIHIYIYIYYQSKQNKTKQNKKHD